MIMAFGKALPRVALATVLTAALVPNSAHAQIPIPEARWVSEVAGTCEPGLAFGKPLGEHYGGNPVVWAGEAAAPLRFVEFTRTPRSRKLISAELTAAFASDLGERDILALAAQSLVDRVDGAIGAAGVLSDRRTDPETGAVVWSSLSADGLSGVRMELLAVETAAYFLCQDVAMVRLAADEAAGRARVGRPERLPRLPRPSVDAAACVDPTRARAEVDAFVAAGGQDVGRVLGAAAVQYEDLVQWYGQQILDKGGWTQAEREAFAEEVQFDEVITSGWTTQVDGGNIIIAFQLNVAEEADAMEACETALGVNRIVRMIEDVNHQQWDRLTELYGAEAVRRGVSLD
jgi:hypothetical protein